ncbi:MAG: hypothetical protein GYB53_03750 [Rhodobacteraceae bacterium]|nr:hypothetical protein [Paracoccaceae bacterium]MBR9822838.1 hypothetical protein [Paracoccaceae bacterium]
MARLGNLVLAAGAALALTACGGGYTYIPATSGGNAGSLAIRNNSNVEIIAFVNPCQDRQTIVLIGGSMGAQNETAVITPGGTHQTAISPGCYWVTYGQNGFGGGSTYDEVYVGPGEAKSVSFQ